MGKSGDVAKKSTWVKGGYGNIDGGCSGLKTGRGIRNQERGTVGYVRATTPRGTGKKSTFAKTDRPGAENGRNEALGREESRKKREGGP